MDHCGLGDPLWDSSRIVPTAVAGCGLFRWLLLPHWHLLASAVLHHALGTATCLPYCKPSSANTVLKPDQELVNWEMEQSVVTKQQAREVENSAALIFLTIFVVALGLLIGFTPLQLHLGWCLNCCSVFTKNRNSASLNPQPFPCLLL